DRASIVVEGKSDYYILRYASRLLGIGNLPLIPGLGAGTFGALVALHLGWGLNTLFLLDGDRKGKVERDRYIAEYGLRQERVLTLDELEAGVSVIEDLLDDQAKQVVSAHLSLSSKPTKNQVRRFFQESLAQDHVPSLG